MPVEVAGLDETIYSLKNFAPDLYKDMLEEIDPAMQSISDRAKGMVRARISGLDTGWTSQGREAKSRSSRKRGFPKYDPWKIRKGLGYDLGTTKRNRSGFVQTFILQNHSASGAIYETAGRKNPQGRAPFVNISGDKKGKVQGYEGTYKSNQKFLRRKTGEYASNNPMAGYQFVKALDNQQKLVSIGRGRKREGRLLYKAFYDDQGKVQDAVMKAIEKAKNRWINRVSKAGYKSFDRAA
jgi:hypothetical protein